MRILRYVALALALLAMPAGAAAHTTHHKRPACHYVDTVPTASNSAELSQSVECLVNRERARAGLRALRHSIVLDRVALAHTQAMVALGFFSHDGPDGTVSERFERAGYIGPNEGYTIGENILWAAPLSYATPAKAVQLWMESPGHRANILHAGYVEAGTAELPAGTNWPAPEAEVYTQDFGVTG